MTEAYICDARRTPIGRYGGALSGVRADDLAAIPLRALLDRYPRLRDPIVSDIILGCANQAGEDNRNVARMAGLLSGFGEATPGSTVNRLCGSGMDAVVGAARAVRAGDGELFIAGGVESMSRAPFVLGKADTAFSRAAELHDTTIGWRFLNRRLADQFGCESMPETAENVAREFGISREDQDAFAFRSQSRAAAAQKDGRLAVEICPAEAPQRKGPAKTVEQDEHLRETSLDALARLRPIVTADGTVTAGNASGVNDGAAAIIIASQAGARKVETATRARLVAAAVAGVPPRIMGVGPAPASERVLERAGLRIADIDVVEINEAFASQALYTLRRLGLPDDAEHANPNGGAIALGHPLGMSGARLVMTAVEELHRRSARYALCAMCIGVGQGVAVILERC